MAQIGIIYSGDYDFQILQIVFGSYDDTIDEMNRLEKEDFFKENKVEHYDTIHFENVTEMNEWIIEQVKEGREKLHKE
jgi:hypothetical protein